MSAKSLRKECTCVYEEEYMQLEESELHWTITDLQVFKDLLVFLFIYTVPRSKKDLK